MYKIFLLLFLLFPILALGEQVEVPMTVAATGKILIEIKIEEMPVTCIVDTGSPAFLLIEESVADKLHARKAPVRVPLRFFAEDNGGQTFGVRFKKVTLGPWDFENVPALTIDNIRRATGIGYRDLPNFWAEGIVGMGFLQQFHLRIDYQHNRLFLDPNYPLTNAAFGFSAPIAMVSTASGSRPFLVDTGSTFSIVSSEALLPLGISYLSLSNADPLFKGTTKADRLQIGNATFKNVTLEVADHFQEYAGENELFGIIGYDLLKELILDFDFPNHKLTLEKP